MSEESIKPVVEGGNNPNPSNGGGQPTVQEVAANLSVNPVNPQPTADAKLKELSDKIEILSRQYAGSTAEALRLKEENEKLKKAVEEAKAQPSNAGATFQKLMEEKGLEAAIEHLVGGKIASIQSKVDGIFEKESNKIYDTFKAAHKGLENVQVLEKFEKEFATLKNVYSDITEALEKAYVLAGGKEAETTPVETLPKNETNKESENVVKNVVGGDADRRAIPVTTTQLSVSEIQQRINDLEFQAAVLDRQGRDTTQIWVDVDKLKSQLAGKV